MTLSPPSEPAQRTTSYMGDSDAEVAEWGFAFATIIDADPAAFGLTVADAAGLRQAA